MTHEPSLYHQLNAIIEYLNFNGPLFVNIPSNLESADKQRVTFSSETESL
ncbi:MAG: hypothetical protein ACFFB5_18760 [Promethearchaeota archaeon]